MVRTQVQLTEGQVQALKEIAAERILEEQKGADKWQRALAVIGRYSDPKPDVSTDHDRYLEEVYREQSAQVH